MMNLPHPLTISMKSFPGSVQDRINFCSSQEKVGLGHGGYSEPLHNISRDWEKRLSPKSQEGPSSRQINMAESHVYCWVGGFLWRVTFLVPSVIGIVAAAVCFLISVLFQVNCSYLNPQSLLFVPPIPCFGALEAEGRREGEQHVVLVGLLNWRISFQKHNTSYCSNAVGDYLEMLGRKT